VNEAGGVLGVVPVGNTRVDGGPLALRDLAGTPLVRTAVQALVGSGAVHRVVVTVPAGLRPAVTAAVGPVGAENGSACPVLVVEVGDPGPAAVLVALDRGGIPPDRSGPDRFRQERVVVVQAPEIVATPDAVRRVVDALVDENPPDRAAGALTVCAVTDTLKTVGPDGAVLGTVDRERHLALAGPQAYRVAPLLAALAVVGDLSAASAATASAAAVSDGGPDRPVVPGPADGRAPVVDLVVDLLPGYLLRAGASLTAVRVTPGIRRITSAADLVLAEAVVADATG
jgi:2-C-methyl-D-erythritol 4-phosphate cytidylyltransferase